MRAYFSRAFKASVSVSYSEFVTRMRLDLAKHLLLTTDRPIAEIALICGLSDQSHLTRLFSRSVGFPPRAWRRRPSRPHSGKYQSRLTDQFQCQRRYVVLFGGGIPAVVLLTGSIIRFDREKTEWPVLQLIGAAGSVANLTAVRPDVNWPRSGAPRQTAGAS